jgi:hypothetical protein
MIDSRDLHPLTTTCPSKKKKKHKRKKKNIRYIAGNELNKKKGDVFITNLISFLETIKNVKCAIWFHLEPTD